MIAGAGLVDFSLASMTLERLTFEGGTGQEARILAVHINNGLTTFQGDGINTKALTIELAGVDVLDLADLPGFSRPRDRQRKNPRSIP